MTDPLRGPRSEASTTFIERLTSPVHVFTNFAAAGGILLLVAAVVAIVWANSPWAASYHHLWETMLGIEIGLWSLRFTLHHLINDGLMAVMFFVVGLEIKREMIAGELKTLRKAALPMVAALGGMVVPAAFYMLVNTGTASAGGWGIPMATDIAFALGVLALLGTRVPISVKVFLTALAIVDDIGAVLVIAIFYSSGLLWGAVTAAAVLLLLAVVSNRVGVRNPSAYAAIGLALWLTVLVSGVHATVAGVLLALTIPTRTRLREGAFIAGAEDALQRFRDAAERTATDPNVTLLSNHGHHDAVGDLEILAEHVQPPLIRLERALKGLVAFGIMPLFALANAGVSLNLETVVGALAAPVTLGVILGLTLGKPIGITLFSWIAVRIGVASLPVGVTWSMIAAAGMLGGIGFTMSIFISGLAFVETELIEGAKVGILLASLIAGAVGLLVLRRAVAPLAKELRDDPVVVQQ